VTERTSVRRLPEKARTNEADLHAVLDAALVAHVAVVDDGQPFVLPMACARDGGRLLLHGSTGSRLMRRLDEGAPVCATVTLLDGLVYARSAFESSMNYRSAMVLGVARRLEGDAALEGLRLLTEHLLPGRWDTLRAPSRKELAATMVLEVPLTEWSVKVSDGPPDDDPADLAAPVWAGVLPLRLTAGEPVDAPDLREPVDARPVVAGALAALDAAAIWH
jgi:nitroimidazol reductase NimA-like FMN-containing flavoprotein (pyridoxamine 5'-phosphate oxidase superfamily)